MKNELKHAVKSILPGKPGPTPREADVQPASLLKKPQQVRDFERRKR